MQTHSPDRIPLRCLGNYDIVTEMAWQPLMLLLLKKPQLGLQNLLFSGHVIPLDRPGQIRIGITIYRYL